jgi:hypothetical protein
MRSYSTTTVAAITERLFRLQSLLEQIDRECDKDHGEIMELIRREMKAAVDALQPEASATMRVDGSA